VVNEFVDEWIAAWNSHDLERILALYDDDFTMHSPYIQTRLGIDSGKLKGKQAIGEYWQSALNQQPSLHFELIDRYAGVNSVCIVYQKLPAKSVCENLLLNEQFKIQAAYANHHC